MMIKITEPYADVGWTHRADADAEELWVFFDMKDGTKPEGSVLITHCGCVAKIYSGYSSQTKDTRHKVF